MYSSDPKKPTGIFRKAAVAFAVQHGALGNIKRKRNGPQVQGAMDEDGESDNAEGDENAEQEGEEGEEGEERQRQRTDARPFDESALAKWALHGDMVTSVEFGQVVQSFQDELYEQQLELAYLRGEQLGTLRKHTFQVPGAHLSDAERRYMNRVLQAAEPLMQRLWELTDGDNDSAKGLTNFFVHHVQASISGSGVHEYRRWLEGNQAVHEFMQLQHVRRRFERERKLIKLWTPSQFVGRQRQYGGTQRTLRADRLFMSTQCYSNEKLLLTHKGQRQWIREWFPGSWKFSEPVELDAADGDLRAQLDAARCERAERACAAAESERLMTMSETEKAKEKAKAERKTAAAAKAHAKAQVRARAAHAEGESEEEEAEAEDEAEEEGEGEEEEGEGEEEAKLTRESGAYLAGLTFAEVVQHKGRRVCFLLEVLKKPGCVIKLLPYLMRHLLEVADAEEFHLIVKVMDGEGNAWTRTLAAQWMYTELGFRDPKKMDPNFEYLPTAMPSSEQLYLVVPARVLRSRVRDLLKHGKRNTFGELQMCVSEECTGEWAQDARSLIEAEHAEEQTPPGDGATFDSLLPADAEIRDEFDEVTALVVKKIVTCAIATHSTHTGWEIFTSAEAERAGLGTKPTAPPPDGQPAVVQQKIKTFGSPELLAPMCMLLLARQCGNCPTTGSKATKIAYKLTNDKGSVKTMNRLTHGINVAQMELICCGVTSPHWGEAAVKYAYRLAGSCDFVAPLRVWMDEDNREAMDAGFGPFLPQMEPLRAPGGLVVPHLILDMPPLEFDEDWNLEKRHDVGGPMDWNKRLGCITDVPHEAHGVVSNDLKATMNLCDKQTRYANDCPSSPFHKMLHGDQSRIAQVHELDDNVDVEEEVRRRFAGYSEDSILTLIDSIEILNDPSSDFSHAVQPLPTRPKQQKPAAPVAQPGSKSRVAVGKAAATSGASQAKAKKGAGSTELEWAWESMRARKFEMGAGGSVLDFQSDVDSTEEGWSTKKQPFKRLLLWPVVPTFGERMDMEVCGGDAAVIQMHTALCTLHADMRMKEMLCNTAERALRTKAEGNAGCASAKAFNRTCKDDLKLRHKIAFDETGKVRDSALDGKDCKLLNEDWLLLEHDDLEAQPPVWNVKGSKYFRSLAEGISKMNGSHELLVALGRTAICTRNYAQAMRELRKGPAAIRESEGGMVGTHKRFEAHARTFVLRWIESGETLKGYGWHLWTSLITLFRRYGCLELICQTAMEGTIGKLGRIMPRIALHARGRYNADTLAGGPEAKQAELERRRTIVMEPEEAIFTELQMEMLFAEYEILPCRKKTQGYSHTLKELMIKVDTAIKEGRLTPHKVYNAKWLKYRGYMLVKNVMKARVKMRASQRWAAKLRRPGRTYTQKLMDEYREYYRVFPPRRRGDVDDLQYNTEMRARKKDYHDKKLREIEAQKEAEK